MAEGLSGWEEVDGALQEHAVRSPPNGSGPKKVAAGASLRHAGGLGQSRTPDNSSERKRLNGIASAHLAASGILQHQVEIQMESASTGAQDRHIAGVAHPRAHTPHLPEDSRRPKTQQLPNGRVHGVPAWMLNPALGGLNPLPVRPALQHSKRIRRTRIVDAGFQRQQALSAEHRRQKALELSSSNSPVRGTVTGGKLSPTSSFHQLRSHGVRQSRAQSVEPSTRRPGSRGGHILSRPMSTAPGMLPHEQGGASLRAGFYFDESKSMATVRASPATPLRCPAAGGLCGSTVEGPGAPRCERWGSPEAWRPATHAGGERGWDKLEFQEASCPVSTGGGTRRVQSVREGGGGGGWAPAQGRAAPGRTPRETHSAARSRSRGRAHRAGRLGTAGLCFTGDSLTPQKLAHEARSHAQRGPQAQGGFSAAGALPEVEPYLAYMRGLRAGGAEDPLPGHVASETMCAGGISGDTSVQCEDGQETEASETAAQKRVLELEAQVLRITELEVHEESRIRGLQPRGAGTLDRPRVRLVREEGRGVSSQYGREGGGGQVGQAVSVEVELPHVEPLHTPSADGGRYASRVATGEEKSGALDPFAAGLSYAAKD